MSLENLPKQKAELIARDQIGKFFGKLTENRANDIGITKYIWSTAHDAAVRSQHAANEGKIFSFEKGDSEGNNPGQAINCRCTAILYFQELF